MKLMTAIPTDLFSMLIDCLLAQCLSEDSASGADMQQHARLKKDSSSCSTLCPCHSICGDMLSPAVQPE